jgi:hypothetical protein
MIDNPERFLLIGFITWKTRQQIKSLKCILTCIMPNKLLKMTLYFSLINSPQWQWSHLQPLIISGVQGTWWVAAKPVEMAMSHRVLTLCQHTLKAGVEVLSTLVTGNLFFYTPMVALLLPGKVSFACFFSEPHIMLHPGCSFLLSTFLMDSCSTSSRG